MTYLRNYHAALARRKAVEIKPECGGFSYRRGKAREVFASTRKTPALLPLGPTISLKKRARALARAVLSQPLE